jgi:hypothetical protein
MSTDIRRPDRNSAYNYWVPDLDGNSPLIVNGGYLVRSAAVKGKTLCLKADYNATTTIELIGVPSGVTSLQINDNSVQHSVNSEGNWVANPGYASPKLKLPTLSALDWKYIDSLPEIKSSYDDSAWPKADHTATNNTYVQPLLTPVSLFASDYGFHAGALLFRGHFTASGSETTLYLSTQGGSAYGMSAWINGTFVGSWAGNSATAAHNDTLTLPALTKGKPYVITILIDNMGINENWVVGVDEMKGARGILNYALQGSNGTLSTPVSWKLTGNLGGEDYADQTRGPLNEGGLFIERQGYHQGSPPSSKFSSGSQTPFTGLSAPGVAFYTAKLTLDLPSDKYDIPLSFTFTNVTAAAAESPYRAWLYINGFQFGRYVSNIGPQTDFPVPEGILNYSGDNWVGLVIWAPDAAGAKVPGFALTAKTPMLTGRETVKVVRSPTWKQRAGAY